MRVFSLFYLDVLFFHVCLFLGVRLVALDGLQLKSFVTWQVDETESIKMDKCLDVLLWANLAGWLIIKLHWLCWQTQSIWAEFPCGPEWGAYPSDRAGVTHPYFSCVFTSERNDSSAWRLWMDHIAQSQMTLTLCFDSLTEWTPLYSLACARSCLGP